MPPVTQGFAAQHGTTWDKTGPGKACGETRGGLLPPSVKSHESRTASVRIFLIRPDRVTARLSGFLNRGTRRGMQMDAASNNRVECFIAWMDAAYRHRDEWAMRRREGLFT
jgi:hypothetical protein